MKKLSDSLVNVWLLYSLSSCKGEEEDFDAVVKL